MTFALLFSLALHIVLLFFVRFAQPSWSGLANTAAPLNVILKEAPAEIAKPSAIAQADQSATGKAKTGVQENNPFPQQPVTATRSAPSEQQPGTKIPKAVISEEVMTVKKPAKTSVPESTPDLLVTQPPPSESVQAPYAPAPGVEKTQAAVTPPAEKLVSVEPAPGEKQEKVVFAEAAQKKAEVEKPGSGTEEPKPAQIEEPAPAPVEAPTPAKPEEPPPVVTEAPEPVQAEAPVIPPPPVKVEEPKPAETEKPEPPRIAEPLPVKAEEPKPEAIQPASAEATAASSEKPSEGGKPNMFQAKPPAFNLPSLADLSIAAVKQFANDDNRKIRFGEPRRKTIGIRERDFRYAMYADGVRQKLERIGKFNYPAEAARKNLSGTLSVLVSIRADGSLENFSIVQPSDYEVLNAGAEKIVRMADPFAPLPDNIRQETDVLTIRINWSFTASQQSFD